MNSILLGEAVSLAYMEVQSDPQYTTNVIRQREYWRRRDELETAWRKDFLFPKYGAPAGLDEGVMEILFAYAWEEGHSNGYFTVESMFDDLCKMQAKIKNLTPAEDVV